ncbi:MAG: hypothetical protein HY645_01990 [Acidobacteria bacterium]|nr:hypothetical protein [Acidobacteriota bacterium]
MESPLAGDVLPLLLAGLGLLLFVWLVSFFLRSGGPSARELESSSPRKVRRNLKIILQTYRRREPLFCELVNSYQRVRPLETLVSHRDARIAFQTLAARVPRHDSKRKTTSLRLGQGDESQIRAAMATIIRSAYLDKEWQRNLNSRDEMLLDRLLEKLTAEQAVR